ncbi:hypothetical protein [Terasakiella sp.]|uniref:hypothetical protein n=1 Tax=Terasakiella sp. TaxID=2034861 RepID=UPI003AA8AD0A
MLRKQLLRNSAICTVAFYLSGCALFEPVDTPISKNLDLLSNIPSPAHRICTNTSLSTDQLSLNDFYHTDSCLAFADTLIAWKSYRDAADDLTNAQSMLNVGVLGLAAATIWAAVTETSTDNIARFGIGSAVLYSGSRILAPEQRRKIYRTGAKAAACIMRRANGLLTDPVVPYYIKIDALSTEYDKLNNEITDFQEEYGSIKIPEKPHLTVNTTNRSKIQSSHILNNGNANGIVIPPKTNKSNSSNAKDDPRLLKEYAQKLHAFISATEMAKLTDKTRTIKVELLKLKQTFDSNQSIIDQHKDKLSQAAAEITQKLIELDDNIRELLDETLPNPSTIFDTVQQSSMRYLGDATPLYGFVSQQINARDVSPPAPLVSADNVSTPHNLHGTPQPIHPDQTKIDAEVANKVQQDLAPIHHHITTLVETHNLLKNRIANIQDGLANALKKSAPFNFADCENLGGPKALTLSEKEISLVVGETRHVSVFGGKSPVRTTMTKRPSGLTFQRSINRDGDTEFAVTWKGNRNDYGTYPVHIFDDRGANDTLNVKLVAGISMSLTPESLTSANNSFTLSVNGEPNTKYNLRYQGTITPVPTFKTYALGTDLSTNKQAFAITNLDQYPDKTSLAFVLVSDKGHSAAFQLIVNPK